ncbi:MAG: hypothetical protein Ct9H300mP29_1470 [Candidatus Neomarinimicrobiota bacterium]|nr:MAG: hypothetical protein Ct9H300mP29_1470 [Candidatus Neomarinimicrobiota bacterium]
MHLFYVRYECEKIPQSEDLFGNIEHAIRKVIMEHGGSISHHHGVGKLRKDFMGATLSNSSMELIKDMKSAHDPGNVFGIGNGIFAK